MPIIHNREERISSTNNGETVIHMQQWNLVLILGHAQNPTKMDCGLKCKLKLYYFTEESTG